MAAHLVFADKSQTAPYDPAKINADDINAIKAAVNLLQATVIAATTDNSTGTSGGDTVAAITNPTISAWDGSSVYPSAADATNIKAAIVATANAVATLIAKQNAIIATLKAVGLMATS